MKASPPTPVIMGSVTLSMAAIAIAASTALPPRLRTSRPTCEASGWLVATIACWLRTTDRPGLTWESRFLALEILASEFLPGELLSCAEGWMFVIDNSAIIAVAMYIRAARGNEMDVVRDISEPLQPAPRQLVEY